MKDKIKTGEVREVIQIKEEIELMLETEMKRISMIMQEKKKNILKMNKIGNKDQIYIINSKMI
jgi:hypothetical protein